MKGVIPNMCLAGRPGKYCTDATDEKVFVRLVSPSPCGGPK